MSAPSPRGPSTTTQLLAAIPSATPAIVAALEMSGLSGVWASPDNLLLTLADHDCPAGDATRILWATMPYRSMLRNWTTCRDALGDRYLAAGEAPGGILPGTGWSDPTTPFGALVRRLLVPGGATPEDVEALPDAMALAASSGGRAAVGRFLAEADFLSADEPVLPATLEGCVRLGDPAPFRDNGSDRVGDALYVRGLDTDPARTLGWEPPGERDPYVTRRHDAVAEPFDRAARMLVERGAAEPSRRDLARIAWSARRLMGSGRHDEIDDVLRNMPFHRLAPVTALLVLRVTLRHRGSSSTWKGARDVVGDDLSRRMPRHEPAMARLGWVRPEIRFEEATRLILDEAPVPATRRDRVDHMVAMHEILSLGLHAPVDAMLARADATTLGEVELIHLVRSTFSARSVLPSWEGFRDAVGDRFERDGKPAARMMEGLDWVPAADRDASASPSP